MLILTLSLLACDSGPETAPEPTAAPAPEAPPAPLGCPGAEAMTGDCANQLYATLVERIGEAETNLTPLPADAGAFHPTSGFYPDAINTPQTLTAHLHPIATDRLIESFLRDRTSIIQGKIAVDVEGCGGPGFLVVEQDSGWVVVADVDEEDRGDGEPIAFARADDGRWRIDGTAMPAGAACGGQAMPM